MSTTKFENGTSYYDITRKIEEFLDRHPNLDSKQEKEENLRDMILYTMEYPEYMNHYDTIRETLLENIRSNYLQLASDPELQTACIDWLEMFDNE